MEDGELEQIRAARLAQMQAAHGGGGVEGNAKAQQEQMQQMEEAKNSILSQVLSQDARARLNLLKMSKPEKGGMVENMIIRMAQTGQIGAEKISEQELIGLLETVNRRMPRSTSSVKFDRRRAALDSDDDDM